MTLAGRRLELRRDGRSAHLQINAPAESAAKMTDSLATCAQVAAGTAPVLSAVAYTTTTA